MRRIVVGVDVGGTFTDLVCVVDGRLLTYKLPSTPPAFEQAVLAGLAALGVAADEVAHGTTVATNALLERRGASCGLLTTAGFRDVLEIGRQARPALYDLDQTKPPPLIPREHRLEVDERVGAEGQVVRPLDPATVEQALAALQADGVESLAVCLLFSFLRPEHEQAVAQRARELGFEVSASVEILPEFREYERTATTVVNAYVAPVMRRYLNRMADALDGRPLRVMQSNGGCIAAETAGREAVRTVLSGPAAGVVGAVEVARRAGYERVIGFDMGGTSTDVSLADGRLPLTRETVVAGLPVAVPALDIHTIGAGGGSLAWGDPGGALAVGPESAGADPGPACYARGGTRPTVTDAHVVLGRLPVDAFLGGRMRLDRGLAEQAIGSLADELGLSLRACAEGILAVANAHMERAMRVVSIERGHDPREFMLVSFGGAGGLHAADLARSLELAGVLIPPHPGCLSALGLLLADVVHDGARTVMQPLDELTAAELAAWFDELEASQTAALAATGQAPSRLERFADLRYRGQSFELSLPVDQTTPAALAAAFHAAHAARYGYARSSAPVELVALRVRAVASTPEVAWSAESSAEPARPGKQRVRLGDGRDVPLYQLERLRPSDGIDGPAILAGADTTVVIPEDYSGTVDPLGNLLLQRR